jgi:hypothetical protein
LADRPQVAVMTEIDREFDLTLDTLGPDWFARFAKMGIPTRVTFGLRSLYGVGRIIPNPSGFFEFHEDGTEALIVAEGEPDLPGWHCLDDLVAFMPDNPGQWWLRRGQVDLLGGYTLTRHWHLEPTRLHSTPLDWLRGGARGVCVLNWRLDPLHELVGGPALVVDSPALRDRLERRTTEVALGYLNVTLAETKMETHNAARS